MNDNFRRALEGEHNKKYKLILADFLSRGDAVVTNFDGKLEFTTAIRADQKGEAYALANWDQYEHCNALITHDLHSFTCRDLGGLICKLRCE